MKLTRNNPSSLIETEFRVADPIGIQINRTCTFTNGKYKGKRVNKELILSHNEIAKLQEFIDSLYGVNN